MDEKLSIAVLCGGRSAEHEISILSTQNVASLLDTNQFNVVVIYLSQQGRWYLIDFFDKNFNDQQEKPLVLIPGNAKKPFALEKDPTQQIAIDCVIPMLHGTGGEDGSIQGLLEIFNIPYVGSDVIGSALCMKKHIAKRLLRFAGLPIADWIHISRENSQQFNYDVLARELGSVFFIKPSALGSSIGVSKVRNAEDYERALYNAFQYDNDVIAERYIRAREIECSVLGNQDPVASLPGELLTSHDFYSYEAKYLDTNALQIITPANLSEAVTRQIQELAIASFKVLQCKGMARVDFFLTDEHEVLINEINTIPGFTHFSMYPKNWEASGLSHENLIQDLIQLALGRHHQLSTLSHYYLGSSNAVDDTLFSIKKN